MKDIAARAWRTASFLTSLLIGYEFGYGLMALFYTR